MSEITFIVVYAISMLLLYIFIYKRLTYLNKRHIAQVWCMYLETRKKRIMIIIFFLFILLFTLVTFLVLTLF